MITLSGLTVLSGKISWQLYDDKGYSGEEGLKIVFPFLAKVTLREALKIIQQNLILNKVEWFYFDKKNWIVDFEKLKHESKVFSEVEFFKGKVLVSPEIDHYQETVFDEIRDRTNIQFLTTKQDIMEGIPKKIFLSHKGVDKPIIRDFKHTIESLGFDSWLDEDSMVAGKELERALLEGFKESCAAVFFITDNYIDENYLATEVNYAIAEKRSKGDRFSIITIVLPGHKNFKIPELLKPYVWKEPQTQLAALREIIRALPIVVGNPSFKEK